MYEAYWGLRDKPFQNTPNTRFLFYSDSHEEALVRMLYTVTESKGLMLLMGEHGAGKSYTCQVFAREIASKGYPVAFIKSPGANADDLLVQVLYEFGIPSRNGSSRVEKMLRLTEAATGIGKTGRDLIVIVDEAQILSEDSALEQIRDFTNVAGEDRFLISLILSGTPELWAKVVAFPGMRQRVGVSYRILPLSREETAEYIEHRLACAGREQPAFDADAIEVVYSASRGIPRDINTLCDLCLLIGSGEDVDLIKPALVEKAIEEMTGARIMGDRTG